MQSPGKLGTVPPHIHPAGQPWFGYPPLVLLMPGVASTSSHETKDQPRGALTPWENQPWRFDGHFHPKKCDGKQHLSDQQ